MTIHKCDICKKVIKGKQVSVGYNDYGWSQFILCESCGKPVISFLQKYKQLSTSGTK